jgi:hypothetical protein
VNGNSDVVKIQKKAVVDYFKNSLGRPEENHKSHQTRTRFEFKVSIEQLLQPAQYGYLVLLFISFLNDAFLTVLLTYSRIEGRF